MHWYWMQSVQNRLTENLRRCTTVAPCRRAVQVPMQPPDVWYWGSGEYSTSDCCQAIEWNVPMAMNRQLRQGRLVYRAAHGAEQHGDGHGQTTDMPE